MIVRNWFHFFIGENPIEFATPRSGKIGIGAAARSKKETAMTEIDSEIFQLRFCEHEIIMAIHEQEGCFVQIRIGESYFALLLDFERRGA